MIKRFTSSDLDKKYLASRQYEATPIKADFSKLVVNKPWGYEYLMLNTPAIEVWHLFIKQHHATSMHCHPNKKTALLVLEGKAIFSSLNKSIELGPLDTVIIDAGVFHSTQALSLGGIYVLEYETPPMKHDLVRLEDKYGRALIGYEGVDKMVANGKEHPRFLGSNKKIGKTLDLYDNRASVQTIADINSLKKLLTVNSVALVLSGNICSGNKELYKTGDVIDKLPDQKCQIKNLSLFVINRPK